LEICDDGEEKKKRKREKKSIEKSEHQDLKKRTPSEEEEDEEEPKKNQIITLSAVAFKCTRTTDSSSPLSPAFAPPFARGNVMPAHAGLSAHSRFASLTF
jgi:hypothetical protein